MGTYLTVALKKEYLNDRFIEDLNDELTKLFGANNSVKFNTWNYLQEEADYMNSDPEGLKQLTYWKRPITKEMLADNFFWYRYGEFTFKLSGCTSSDEARDEVAICKWVIKTKYKFLNKEKSDNCSSGIIRSYLDNLFIEAGYDIAELWKIP